MSETKKQPIEKFKFGTCEVALWEQESENGNFLTASVSRSYKDKDDKWQNTSSFRINDLPTLRLAIDKAFEHAKSRKEQQND